MQRAIIICAVYSTLVGAAIAQGGNILPRNVLEKGFQQSDCDGNVDDALSNAEMYELGQGLKLVAVDCQSAMFNSNSIVFVVDQRQPGNAGQEQFSEWDTENKSWTHTLTLSSFGYDPKLRRITTVSVFRGMSDCGKAAYWDWNGSAFVMTAYWLKENCDNTPFNPDSDPDSQAQWRIH
jgi:hypothetical protein